MLKFRDAFIRQQGAACHGAVTSYLAVTTAVTPRDVLAARREPKLLPLSARGRFPVRLPAENRSRTQGSPFRPRRSGEPCPCCQSPRELCTEDPAGPPAAAGKSLTSWPFTPGFSLQVSSRPRREIPVSRESSGRTIYFRERVRWAGGTRGVSVPAEQSVGSGFGGVCEAVRPRRYLRTPRCCSGRGGQKGVCPPCGSGSWERFRIAGLGL